MSLIKTIEEFGEFVRIQGTLNADTVLVALPDAQEKYLRKILGDDLLNSLDTWYNLGTAGNEKYKALLPYVQRALARFTIFVVSPELDVQVTGSGIGIVSSQNLAPASSDRVSKFDKNNELRGWDNIETLLKFLEDHASDYPEWTNSDAYTLAIHNLVNSASDFDRIYSINQSRLIFNNYRPVMDNIDLLKIKPSISDAFFNKLLDEIKKNEISDADKLVLPLLQRAEVYFSLSDKPDRSNYEGVNSQIDIKFLQLDLDSFTQKAESFLSQALAVMQKNIDNYPEYRDSGIFDPTTEMFENKIENTVYVMGMGG